MIKTIATALALTISLIGAFSAKAAVHATKQPWHYLREMEFYYQNPNKPSLKGMLRSFSDQGYLHSGENRLMTAAFLAELIASKQLDAATLVAQALKLGRDTRHMAAWAIHLANLPDSQAQVALLLKAENRNLIDQIQHSPAPLLNWSPSTEKTVLQMFWCAFMASGNTSYLDAIINLAIECSADNPNPPKIKKYDMCAAAAASLYDLKDRHPLVQERIKTYSNSQYGNDVLGLLNNYTEWNKVP